MCSHGTSGMRAAGLKNARHSTSFGPTATSPSPTRRPSQRDCDTSILTTHFRELRPPPRATLPPGPGELVPVPATPRTLTIRVYTPSPPRPPRLRRGAELLDGVDHVSGCSLWKCMRRAHRRNRNSDAMAATTRNADAPNTIRLETRTPFVEEATTRESFEMRTSSRARKTSAASCGRSAGAFDKSCVTRLASAGGTSGRTESIGVGDSVRCAAISPCGFRPEKGDAPLSTSYATTPSA